jgi:hypothetical protein
VIVSSVVQNLTDAASVSLAVGDKVEAEFDDEGWVIGTVTQARPDGGIEVIFDADGHVETYDHTGATTELRMAQLESAPLPITMPPPKKKGKLPNFKTQFGDEMKKRTLYDDSESEVPLAPSDIRKGLKIEAVDQTSRWFPGKVVDVKRDEVTKAPTRIKVHFVGFKDTYDKWYEVASRQIRPSGKIALLEKTVTDEINTLLVSRSDELGLPIPTVEISDIAATKAKKVAPPPKISAKRAAREKALDVRVAFIHILFCRPLPPRAPPPPPPSRANVTPTTH